MNGRGSRGKKLPVRIGDVVVTTQGAKIVVEDGGRKNGEWTISGTLLVAGGSFAAHQVGTAVWEFDSDLVRIERAS